MKTFIRLRPGLPGLLFLLSLLTMLCCNPQTAAGADLSIFATPLAGITSPISSARLPNIGQSLHVIVVRFPAATGAVSGFAVRLEASFDQATWIPISEDVTTASRVSGNTYNIAAGYAPWPFVRVRVVTPAAGQPMTVHYAAHIVPVISVITEKLDRFIL